MVSEKEKKVGASHPRQVEDSLRILEGVEAHSKRRGPRADRWEPQVQPGANDEVLGGARGLAVSFDHEVRRQALIGSRPEAFYPGNLT